MIHEQRDAKWIVTGWSDDPYLFESSSLPRAGQKVFLLILACVGFVGKERISRGFRLEKLGTATTVESRSFNARSSLQSLQFNVCCRPLEWPSLRIQHIC
eukprot:scaffold79_cov259-Pinguiococcus_pyrenoidosus.AAC.19